MAPSLHVGGGICKPLGIRVYDGTADNPGTNADERRARCAEACFHKKAALQYGPWSSRPDAVGYSLSGGRCYCNHEKFAGCDKGWTYYKAYEYQLEPGAVHFCNRVCFRARCLATYDLSMLPRLAVCTRRACQHWHRQYL